MDKKSLYSVAALVTFLFCAFTFRMITVGPPEVDLSHPFQTDRAYQRLSRILGGEVPHPVDSNANDLVRERLLSEIRRLGFTPIVRDDFHCTEGREAMRCARVRNVLFWVTEPGANAVMVASHYDSVPAGPGAGDDGAGVAASLEIAAILKEKKLTRPLLVVMTDGEEIGLVGAASFVEKDPLAKMVGAVVSMEARGVSGPVSMFQTSTPNGRDIEALKSDIKSSFTNSLAADVYERMPNGTDVTEYLELDIDVGNFAIGGSPEFYHTPRDNLAMLDKRSFFHMGVSALNATQAFLAQSGNEPEKQWIYADIFGLTVLALPQALGLPLIVLGLITAIAVFAVKGGGSSFRALAFPLCAIVFGVGLAITVSLGIGAVRTEVHYAAAHPWALRAVQNSAALLGCLLALSLFAKSVSGTRSSMGGWIFLAIFGGLLSTYFPGAAILFVPSMIVLAVSCGMVFLNKNRIANGFSILAALLFLLIVVPTSAMAEMMLFLEYAAPFTLFLVLGFAVLVPHVLPERGADKTSMFKLSLISFFALVCFSVLAVTLPAYSVSAPRGLSIIHAQDLDTGEFRFAALTDDPLPNTMNEIAPFSIGRLTGYQNEAYVAEAPEFVSSGLETIVQRNEVDGALRKIAIQIKALDSNIVLAQVKQENAVIESMKLNGYASKDGESKGVVCHGRECRTLNLEIAVSVHEPSLDLELKAFRYGFDKKGQPLLSARPKSMLARGWGDLRLLTKNVKLK